MKKSLVSALAATFVLGLAATSLAALGEQKWTGDPSVIHNDSKSFVRAMEGQGITRDFTFYVPDHASIWWDSAPRAEGTYDYTAVFNDASNGGFTTSITPTSTTMRFKAESNSRLDLWVFATKLNFVKGITPNNDLTNKTATDYTAENYDWALNNPINMNYTVTNKTAIKSFAANALVESLLAISEEDTRPLVNKWVYSTNGTTLNDKVDCETGVATFEIGLAPMVDSSFKPHAGVYKGEVKVLVLHP